LPHAGGLTDIVPGFIWFTWPLRLITQNPIAVFNSTMMLCGILNALSFYILTRVLGCKKLACFVSGFSFAFSWFMMSHYYGHITMFGLFPTPLALAAFCYAMRTGSLYAYAGVPLLVFVQGTFSSRLGVLCICSLTVLWLVQGFGVWRKQLWKPLLVPVGLSVAIGAVFLVYEKAFVLREWIPSSRDLMSAVFISADLQGYGVPSPYTLGGAFTEKLFGLPDFLQNSLVVEKYNYWGWPVMLGAFFALGLGIRQKKFAKSLLPWAVLALVGFLFSLGPFLWSGGTLHRLRLPWYYVIQWVPPLQTFRAVARFSLLAGLGLNVMFAFFLSRTMERFRYAPLLIFAFVFLDTLPVKHRNYLSVPAKTNISRFLETLGPDESVIHLPYLRERSPMLHHFTTFIPMANSTSVGTKNPYFIHLAHLTKDFPNPDALKFLKKMGITYVIADTKELRQRLKGDEEFERVTPFAFRIIGSDSGVEKLDQKTLSDLDRLYGPREVNTEFPDLKPRVDFLPGDPGGMVNWNGLKLMGPREEGVLVTTALQPYVVLNLPEPLPAKKIQSVAIRYRTPDTLNTNVESIFYWATPEAWYRPGYEIRSLHKATQDWQVLHLIPDSSFLWDHEDLISSFRFDLFFPSIPGDRVEIDRIVMFLKPEVVIP